MVKQLIFHLGDHKTGSTSIQAALRQQNFKAPLSIFYPSAGNHNALARSLIHGGPEMEKRLSHVARRLAQSEADVGVISAERFEAVTPHSLAQVIARVWPEQADSVRLIAYVRPHAERVLSSYAERIKGGYFSGTLQAFHDRTRARGEFLYHPRFTRWREVFKDRFTLRPMIRDQLQGQDVVQDFLDFVLQGAPVRITPADRRNESLGVTDLAMLQAFQATLGAQPDLTPNQRNQIGWLLARKLSASPPLSPQARPALSHDIARDIVASYAEDAAALDKAFFTGTPMSDALHRAPLAAVDTPPSLAPEDHFDAATLRLIHACADMVADLQAKATQAHNRPAGQKEDP